MLSFTEFLTEDVQLLIENEGRVNFFGVDHLGADAQEIQRAVEAVQRKTSNLRGRVIFKDGGKHINIFQVDEKGNEKLLAGLSKGKTKSGRQGPIIREIERIVFGETYPQRMSRLRTERSSRLAREIPTPESVQTLEDRLTLLRGIPRKEGSDRTKRIDDSISRIQARIEKAKPLVTAALTPVKPEQPSAALTPAKSTQPSAALTPAKPAQKQAPTTRRAFTSKDILSAMGLGTFGVAMSNVWDAAGALVAQPDLASRMEREEDAQTDLGLGFNYTPEGELEADPAGFAAVRSRQNKGQSYPPTLFPR